MPLAFALMLAEPTLRSFSRTDETPAQHIEDIQHHIALAQNFATDIDYEFFKYEYSTLCRDVTRPARAGDVSRVQFSDRCG